MTLQEYLEAMAATQGRQNRGQTNLTTAQRAQLEQVIRQQYGNIDPARTMWTGTIDDNPIMQFGARPDVGPAGILRGRTGDGLHVDAQGRVSFGQYHDTDTNEYFRILGDYDDAGALTGIDYRQFTPEGGWINEGNNALMATLAALGGMAYAGAGAAAAEGAGAASAAGGAAAMTPAEALAAGVAPGAVGGGSMSGVVGGTAAAAGGAAGLGSLAGGAATVGSLLSNPAVIGGGLSLVGGAIGADAAGDAAEMQQRSADAAIEEVRRQYDQDREDQMPWLEAGRTSLADLMGQMGALNQPFTQADFQNDPGYQFELSEGQRALDAAARARGMYGSTGALRELTRYSQGLASTRYQDAWNRDLTQRQNTYNQLAGVAGTGQTAAGNLAALGQNRANTVGDLLTQSGNAQAAGRVGSANSWINAGSQALNNWQQQALINRLGSNLYR